MCLEESQDLYVYYGQGLPTSSGLPQCMKSKSSKDGGGVGGDDSSHEVLDSSYTTVKGVTVFLSFRTKGIEQCSSIFY